MPTKTRINRNYWATLALILACSLSQYFLGITPAGAAAQGDEEINAKLKAARLLTIDKKYEPALANYLWIFEHSRKLQKWQGMRNALVSQELVKLAEVYDPAKAECSNCAMTAKN